MVSSLNSREPVVAGRVFEHIDGVPTVTFYTYSGMGGESLERHIDSFAKRSYSFRTDGDGLAEGPGGYLV